MWQERKYIEKLKSFEINKVNYLKNSSINSLLIYPNSYYSGMSYLGFLQLYKFLNEEGITNCDRFFFEDWKDPITFDNYRYVSDFEVLLFSIPFEGDFENVIKILRDNNIEPNKNKRKRKPLIIGGGPSLWINPYPLKNVFDIFVLGEGEEKLRFVFNHFRKIINGDNNVPKMKGVLFELPMERKAILNEITFEKSCTHIPYTKIITKNSFFSNMFLLEIARGCINNCKFCTVSRLYHNKCFRDLDSIKKVLDEAKGFAKKVGLISSMVLEHPHIEDILQYCYDKELEVSTSSLSVKGLTNNIVKLLRMTNNKSITIALESLSSKTRKEINKDFTDLFFLEKIKMILENNIKTIKIYLILGLPYEKDDLKSQVSLWKQLLNLNTIFKANIHFSINPLIPQPYTPYYNLPMQSKKTIRSNYKWFKENFKGLKLKFEGINNSLKEYNYAYNTDDILEKM
ncbi:radical SAM protein [bacterium]|nr:radical SAM protein [bacterium]